MRWRTRGIAEAYETAGRFGPGRALSEGSLPEGEGGGDAGRGARSDARRALCSPGLEQLRLRSRLDDRRKPVSEGAPAEPELRDGARELRDVPVENGPIRRSPPGDEASAGTRSRLARREHDDGDRPEPCAAGRRGHSMVPSRARHGSELPPAHTSGWGSPWFTRESTRRPFPNFRRPSSSREAARRSWGPWVSPTRSPTAGPRRSRSSRN